MSSDQAAAEMSAAAQPPEQPASASFRQLFATGFRTVNAVWLAPALIFLLLGPQQTAGAITALLAMRDDLQPAPGRPVPASLIAMAVLGIGSCFWLVVVFVGLPWVSGGAAGAFREVLIRPERRRSFVEHANYFFGRSMVLMILFVLLMFVLYIPQYVLSISLMSQEGLFTAQPDLDSIRRMTYHPAILASTFLYWLVAAGVLLLWDLTLAVLAVDDQGIGGAFQKTLSFLRRRPSDAGRLYLVLIALGAPSILLQQSIFLFEFSDVPVVTITFVTSIYSAYTIMLNLAIAESLYIDRRRTRVV